MEMQRCNGYVGSWSESGDRIGQELRWLVSASGLSLKVLGTMAAELQSDEATKAKVRVGKGSQRRSGHATYSPIPYPFFHIKN